MLIETILFEMNVANLDQIKSMFILMLDRLLVQRELQIPANLHDLIIKRAVKAMQNDETGNMVDRQELTTPPDNAPKWLNDALMRGDTVYYIDFKDGFETRLAHVIDWMTTDPNAARIIKATPEEDFLGNIAKAADDYYEARQKSNTDQVPMEEVGREIVMTFRADPQTRTINHYMESSLAPDPERGPIVAFWCKLTTDAALDREGRMMGHCVGSYCDMVKSNQVTIFSLRDAKNEPHATVELRNPAATGTKTPTINQVKGRGNLAPTGKYAPYIRDFLNELGVVASSSGAGDLRGIGLLTHRGKYGTILEVGGDLVATFANGDSIRIIEEPKKDVRWVGPRGQRVESITIAYYYVEKNGTTPFELEFGTSLDRKSSEGLRLIKIRFFREERSRYSTYAKNLVPYLNEKHVASNSIDILAPLGIYFDNMAKDDKWGTAAALTNKLFDYKGVNVSRFTTTINLTYRDGVFAKIHFSANPTPSIHRVDIEQYESPALKLLPELITQVCKYFGVDGSYLTDTTKKLFANYNIFPSTKGFQNAPENKQIFQSKHGSVRHYQHRFMFYDSEGSFVGSIYVGNGNYALVPGRGTIMTWIIKRHYIISLGKSGLKAILWLLVDMTHDPSMNVRTDNINSEEIKAAGFFDRNGVVVPISQVSFNVTNKGYKVKMTPDSHGGRTITLTNDGMEPIEIKIDNNDLVSSIYVLDSIHRSRWPVVAHRAVIAAAMNVAKVKLDRRDLLMYGLTIRGDKFYPQNDRNMIAMAEGRPIDLGDNFQAKLHIDSIKSKNETFGYIDIHGTSVVYLRWSYESHVELSYQMVRRTPTDDDGERISRQRIIRAAAKFMRIFHQKIEPYLGGRKIVGTNSTQHVFSDYETD